MFDEPAPTPKYAEAFLLSPRRIKAGPNRRLELSMILIRLAKHLALLACLLIVGEAAGRSGVGDIGIVFVVLAATMLHLAGKSLQRGHGVPTCRTRLRP